MSESLSIETLIKDQKLLISRWQQGMIREDINIFNPSCKQMAEALLIHCQSLKTLEGLSNPSEVVIEAEEF
jgi:hypothetical protein